MIQFDRDCTTPLAERLLRLYSEYVEGNIEPSIIEYKKLIPNATEKDLVYLMYRTPFESQSIGLYDKLTAIIGVDNIPPEVRVKIEIDRVFLANLYR
ncbi:MAG: hypothetical protein EOM67_13690 [Spirochaetia bacterium]|nr:hypothetical protein [Spirochaetia bacterium]